MPPPGPSRLARLARRLRPLVLVLLAVALAAVATLGLRIQTALSDLQEVPSDNLHWNLTQLELDLTRFIHAAELAQQAPAGALDPLRRRYDLFYSRAQNAIAGRGFARSGMQDLAGPLGNLLAGYLARTTPLIDGDPARLRAALPALAREAEALRADLRGRSIAMIERLADLSDARREALRSLVHRAAVISGVSFVVLGLVLALAIWLNHEARRDQARSARMAERLAATVNSALDAIIVADDHGRILEYNPSAAAIFGHSRAQALGQPLGQLIVPAAHRAAHEAGMAAMRQTGALRLTGSGRFETVALHQDGHEFPVELSIAAANGDRGRIFIAYLRDISARRAAETALRDARDAALAAGRAKTEFLAVMSHEMRTPLNGVLAALEIADRLAEPARLRHFLGLARGSARQLLRHAEDVLDIARAEAGGLQITHQAYDPAQVVQDLVAELRPLAREKGLTLALHPLGTVPQVTGDPFRLVQIVQNFLSNAIKFTERGGITVEYEMQQDPGGPPMIELRVTDTGPGIAEADQARIFDDFVMLDPSFRRQGGGAGLGLGIARRLAQAMGGEIGVESEPGAGSCFWLRLPADPVTGAPPAPAAPPLAAVPAAAPAPAPQEVLVVEDNATNRAVLEEMLRHQGHGVTLAADGAQGVAAAAARRFDIILMDISMPGIDGLAATALIRQGGLSAGARIIAVTAHSLPEDLARFRAAGMDGTLVKPISAATLAQAITQAGAGAPPPAAPDDDLLLDQAQIADLRALMGPAEAARLAQRFVDEAAGMVAALAADATALPHVTPLLARCHELAGAAGMIGAAALNRLCAAAELACRQGDADAAQALLARDLAPVWQATAAGLALALPAPATPCGDGAPAHHPVS